MDYNEHGIYIISTFHKSIDSNAIKNDGPDLNIPFHEEPSTSYKENSRVIADIDSDNDSLNFVKPEERNTTRLNTYQSIAQSIIQIMKDSMEHENLYLEYFKKLIELNQNVSDDNAVDIFNIEQIFDISQEENWKKRSDHKLKMKGQTPVRNKMRGDLLNKLDVSYQSKENADVLISELIDLEESFIDN